MNEERNKSGAAATQQTNQGQQGVGRDKGQAGQQNQQPGSQNRGHEQSGSGTNTAPARPGSQDKSKKDDGSCGCDGGMSGKGADSKGRSDGSEE